MNQSKQSEQRDISLIQFVGYGILILFFIDFIYTLILPNFKDPVLAVQTIETLLQCIPLFFIGFVFVFYRQKHIHLQKKEQKILSILSWSSLVLGILFFLLIPLQINSSLAVNIKNNLETNQKIPDQLVQSQQIKTLLIQANNPEDIQNIAIMLKDESLVNIKNLRQSKSKLLTKISAIEENFRAEEQINKKNNRLIVLKNCIKFSFASLVSGIILIQLWVKTSWIRRKSQAYL